MSREIKFRAWDIKNKRFVNIVRLIFDQFGALDYAEVVFKGKIYKLYPPEIVLEQDTGLKDKNDEEICEGDIVGIYNYYYNEETGKDEPGELEPWGVIVYEPPSFGLWGEPIYGNEDKHFFEVSSGMVVIGNIHENPELIDCQSDGLV